MTLSNVDKLRFAEVEDRITREFGDHDTMDFLDYLRQQDGKARTFSYMLGDQDRIIADFVMEVDTLEAMNKDLHGKISELRQEIDKLEDTITDLRADQEYNEEVW